MKVDQNCVQDILVAADMIQLKEVTCILPHDNISPGVYILQSPPPPPPSAIYDF